MEGFGIQLSSQGQSHAVKLGGVVGPTCQNEALFACAVGDIIASRRRGGIGKAFHLLWRACLVRGGARRAKIPRRAQHTCCMARHVSQSTGAGRGPRGTQRALVVGTGGAFVWQGQSIGLLLDHRDGHVQVCVLGAWLTWAKVAAKVVAILAHAGSQGYTCLADGGGALGACVADAVPIP